VLRRPVEPGQYASEQFQRLLADHGITCSMSRSGDMWDNSAMESFFSSLKIERVNRRVYATREEAKADVFDYGACQDFCVKSHTLPARARKEYGQERYTGIFCRAAGPAAGWS
jgi:hypothetical protein